MTNYYLYNVTKYDAEKRELVPELLAVGSYGLLSFLAKARLKRYPDDEQHLYITEKPIEDVDGYKIAPFDAVISEYHADPTRNVA